MNPVPTNTLPQKVVLAWAGKGASDKALQNELVLSEGSVNLYPDPGNGEYLTNYSGRTDLFNREDPGPGEPPLSDPPAQLAMSRIVVFRDNYNQEHLVFVQGTTLYRKVGNGYATLYRFVGRAYDGLAYPTMFPHEGKLVILNPGDKPLIWDGHTNVHPLGVTEVPAPPSVNVTPAPGMQQAFAGGTLWQYRSVWWPGEKPINALCQQEDVDGDPIAGVYQVLVQFQDRYGNKGPPSPPCSPFYIAPAASGEEWTFGVVDWTPPLSEDHIYSMIMGRTAGLHQRDTEGGVGAYASFYPEYVFDNTTHTSAVCQVSDPTLQSRGAMDIGVLPPPSCAVGASFKRRIFLAGLEEDPCLVVWSDLDLFGQFRATSRYRARDRVTAIVTNGDRLIVVTASSVEILYDNSGTVGILSQTSGVGSDYGRSLVDVGGRIFGLWTQGYGFFDGQNYEWVLSPLWVRDCYVDKARGDVSAVTHGDWYWLALRKDSITSGNSHLLGYHLGLKQWFLIEESVRDISWWQGGFIGVDNSIFELFAGRWESSTLIVEYLIPAGADVSDNRALAGVRLLAEASGTANVGLVLDGRWEESSVTSETKLQPSMNAGLRNDQLLPYWDDTKAWNVKWTAPADYWFQLTGNKQLGGHFHRLELNFPLGQQIRLRAIELSFSGDRRA